MNRREQPSAFMREPIRALMELQPGKALRAVLLLILSLAFFLFVRGVFSETGSESTIALLSAVCAAALIVGLWRQCGRQPLMVLLCAALAMLLCVGAHLSLLSIRPGRMTRVLIPLMDELWNYDLPVAMAWEADRWSAGYLIVMALFSRLETFPALYAVKLLDLVCLSAAALAVSHMAKRRGAGTAGIIAAAVLSLMLPTVLLNAGMWAQCDAVFAAFAMWGLALVLEDHPLGGCILWGIALAFKLQSAFLFPLLIPLFFARKTGIRHIALIAAVFLALHAPMLANGQGLASVLGRYNDQILIETYGALPQDTEDEAEGETEETQEEPADETAEEETAEAGASEPTVYLHEGLASHAPSVYQLMTVASVREFSGMGLYLGIACALLVCFLLIRYAPDSEDTWLTAALLLSCGLPVILPQMNARCLYLAGLLSLTRLGKPLHCLQAAVLEAISLCSYMEAIFSGGTQLVYMLPMPVLSLLLIAVSLSLAWELAAETAGRKAKEAGYGAG
ncbi:MAG: DUF2029 domain-containing protein [Clostridia bacterium]|nr:DUF2029 domain-containing protein [Clostridia bacterium]